MATVQHSVLFVCIHNSARSQMAEAFLNKFGSAHFEAESAGLEPGIMNQNVVKVMQEAGIDLSSKSTRSVFDLLKKGNSYDAVITVCDGASAEKCPVFPGSGKRIAWSFEDPSSFKGTPEEILSQTRMVRDEILKSVREFMNEAGKPDYWK
jgi:arsenate reductase (thioredoxin)